MKINFALISDTVLTAFCTFLFVFTLVRYYTYSALIALIFGIVWGVAAGCGAFFYIRHKQRKKLLFGKEAEEKRKLAMHLCILPYDKACGIITAATGGIKKGRHIECENEIYFPVFKAEQCNMDDLLPVLRFNGNGKKKVFICNYIAENARKLAQSCGVGVWDSAEVYKKLKKAEALPASYIYAEPSKTKLFKAIKLRFSKKICLPAFWSGTALMFMSWFTFFPVYYIISGAILLAVCAAAAIFGQPRSI